MKKLLLIISFLFVFQTVKSQTADEILPVLRERVEVGQANQSIVAAVVNEKGTKFISYGKTSLNADAKNSDENTIFEIGSITKVFTGTLLAEAVRRGEVKLDDPISKYLPKIVKIPSRGGKEITLLDLATHSSGLPRMPTNFASKNVQNPYTDYDVQKMYEFLSVYQLTRDIGAQYEYSNLGMGLLGHILSLRAEVSYEDLVKMRILKPLDMNDTTITLSPAQRGRTVPGFDGNGEPTSLWDFSVLAGAGAMRSTAKDMAKFVAANMSLTKTNLSAAFAEAQQPRRSAGGKMKIGSAWHILPVSTGGAIVWHNGGTGGFHSFAGFDADGKKGIVVLTNSVESIDDIGFHFLSADIPLVKIAPAVVVSEKILDEYVGQYELAPNFIFTVNRNGDKLFAELTGQSRLRIFAATENKFYYKAVKAELVFNRGTDGKIESLTLLQNGSNTAKKIK